MSLLPRFGLLPLLGMAVVLYATGCPQSQDQTAANGNQASAQDQAPDPAAANLAPASNDPNGQSQAAYPAPNGGQEQQAPAYQQSAPPPDNGQNYDQGQNQGSDDPGYGQQPVSYAPEPPPPLPEYDQPEAPGDDYMWTPGYWAWGQGGYYWVPGVWVEAPYEGALWTPGYWGFYHNRYGFYGGYWGPHIGYYGGINYGFGYVGIGYEGGYWGGGHFNYNRSYNNVGGGRVHNIYVRQGSDNFRGGARVSFNGGSGGIQVRARPAELAARHDQHAAPMRNQIQNEHVASTNRAQFANVNHGRPASAVVNQPIAADRGIRAPAAVQQHNQAAAQQRQAGPQLQQRQVAPVQQQHQAAPMQQPQRQTNPQPQDRQVNPQQRQMTPQQQPHQAAPMQQPQRQVTPMQQPQRQASPPQQQRQQAPQQPQRQAPQQQRQAPQQQRQAPQQQRPAAPQQHQAAPEHKSNQDHPR
jgi:hypothetical protein